MAREGTSRRSVPVGGAAQVAGAAPGAAPRRRLRSDERQREIVGAVLALARDLGPDAITTQAIADRVGVTQGAIFRHFPDKTSIWLAVFAWVRAGLMDVYARALARGGSPLERIEHAFLGHVAFVAEHPGVPRALFHELQYPGDSPVRDEVRTMIGGLRESLANLFVQARAAGQVAADLDPATATLLFIGAIQSLVMSSALSGDPAAVTTRAPAVFALLRHAWRGGSST